MVCWRVHDGINSLPKVRCLYLSKSHDQRVDTPRGHQLPVGAAARDYQCDEWVSDPNVSATPWCTPMEFSHVVHSNRQHGGDLRAMSSIPGRGKPKKFGQQRRGLRPCDQALDARREPPLGAHLVTPRHGYTHHGIYVGGGHVVQYGGLAHVLGRGPVEEVPLSRFAHGHPIWIRITESGWKARPEAAS